MGKELLIMIPAYNEGQSIGEVLSKIYEAGLNEIGDILVINDGSQDDTEKVVRTFKVTIINQVTNRGYGSALQVGYKYAEKKGYEYVIQMDADGQHDICNIKMIYDCLKNKDNRFDKTPDIVIGSRFLTTIRKVNSPSSISDDNYLNSETSVRIKYPYEVVNNSIEDDALSNSGTMKISKIKLIAIMFFRLVIKIFTKNSITDPTSGLQGLNRKSFLYYAGYGNFDCKYPDLNMIIQMIMLGYNIKEIPAVMHERKTGQGMHSGIIKPIKYMMLIMLSTLSIILRNRKNYYVIGKERTR